VNTVNTSRCPYCAFGRRFRVSFVLGQIMSNHVSHVKSCYSCQIMLFLPNRVIYVKSCNSFQIMLFMSNIVIHVKSCHSSHHSCSLFIKCVIGGVFNKVGWKWVGGHGVSKSAFKAFGGQLCCRPKTKKNTGHTLTLVRETNIRDN
jgi:hypothetical protein